MARHAGLNAPIYSLISPHLDDAVLSGSGVLHAFPGCRVVTVFSGGPVNVDPLPDWDVAAGCFRPGDDVMAARRREDLQALGTLDARAHHLGFWDAQYRDSSWGYDGPTSRSALVAAISEVLIPIIRSVDVSGWIMPLGLAHPDHVLVAEASAQAMARTDRGQWFVYQDLPYAREHPALVSSRMTALAARGFDLTSVSLGARGRGKFKREAVNYYRSQLPALGGRRLGSALRGPESLFHLGAAGHSRWRQAAL